MSAIAKWKSALEAMAIPAEILDAAPDSPWDLPIELFRRRAEAALAKPPTPACQKAEEALPEGGVVLDVGVGVGAASLPLHPKASLILGVDASDDMLAAFRSMASGVGAAVQTIPGAWQEVEAMVPSADVVVCHHVLYNVPDLPPFVKSLSDHARRRVVVEITRQHPLAWTSDLWEHFHGFRRPPGPTSDDAWEALREMGLPAQRMDYEVERTAGAASPDELVQSIRKRLCLPPEKDPDIIQVLGDRLRKQGGGWSSGPTTQALTLLWWDN